MTEKAKNGKPSVWSRMRCVVITTMTGVFLIAIGGFIGAVAISVAGRYEEPDDALANYPRQRELQWHEGPDDQIVVSDFRVAQRIERDDLNAVHFVLLWDQRHDNVSWECVGGLLVGETQDIFGGWQELHYTRGGCHRGSGSGGGGVGGADYWESSPWERADHYYFAYNGTTTIQETIEFILSDGTRESAAWNNGTVGLVIRRDAPFYVRTINHMGGDGVMKYSYPGH